MQDMDHQFTTALDDANSDLFGSGPEKHMVNAARLFCIAFAFIAPTALLFSHVMGGS